MGSRNWRLPLAVLVAVAAAASIVPLRVGSCGPDPVNLWCAAEPFLGWWPTLNLGAGIIVGLLVRARTGALLLVLASLVGFLVYAVFDPWVAGSTGSWTWWDYLNFFLLGGLPAFAGFFVGIVIRTAIRLTTAFVGAVIRTASRTPTAPEPVPWPDPTSSRTTEARGDTRGYVARLRRGRSPDGGSPS
jgi:hypothetical protein